MKINFKTILIIFLVALLGSGLGTYGVLAFYKSDSKNSVLNQDSNVVINEVQYTNMEKSDYTKAIDKAFNTVVEIKCQVQTTTASDFFFFGGTTTSTSAGSGVIFSNDGYIVTNAHVIEGLVDESTLQVKIYTGDIFNAKVIGYDSRTDLAVIKIDADDLPYSSFANSEDLALGQDVIAIGNPLGLGISCSNGIISALDKEIYLNDVYMTVMQTNAAVNAGNSGGGLFDIDGNLVGIVNAKKSSSSFSTSSVEGMAYAIPSNTVIKIINDLIENGYVTDRAALGVTVNRGYSSYYSINGVLITRVFDNSSAKKAGLQENDIIIAIDDEKISSYGDLSKALDNRQIGDEVIVTVIRNDQEMKFNVVLQATIHE